MLFIVNRSDQNYLRILEERNCGLELIGERGPGYYYLMVSDKAMETV